MTTTAAAASAPITSISKYRALMLVGAVELGWTHTQVATNVDQFTKGKGATAEVITLVWGGTQLKAYSHTKGKTLVTTVEGTVGAKLQRAQTSLGKPMELTAKWPKLSAAKVAELEALAKASFKVITPKA
jgi:hypothetical protein